MYSVNETSYCSDEVIPCKGFFIGKEFKVKMNGDGFKLSSFEHAVKTTETAKHHRSWCYQDD